MSENKQTVRRKFVRLLIVGAGIVLGQAILYGPSLIGEKILLPLDFLTLPAFYIPSTPETVKIVPHNLTSGDLVTQFEPARRFAASEIHQGRFPLWAPYQYGGVPFVWPKYSLFLLLECCTKSPVILAWTHLLAALVTGTGMYFFCRKSLRVTFWPAVVCAWGYPLTAFFVLWQGFLPGLVVCWLPWILLLVDKTIRGASSLATIGLSVVTFLVLTSGHIDVAGQVLLGAGIYAIWCLWDAHPGGWYLRKFWTASMTLILGWGLGFLLAAPHLLPLLEYAQSGSRMVHRSEGTEERPPVGLAALPQVVLPDMYGTTEKGSTFMPPGYEANLIESTTAAYTGVFATLLVAPLAWCSRRHRAINLFWIFLAFFGLGWALDVPVMVDLLRLPGLNMMSHNRLVFLTSFAILALTATGLETLLHGPIQRRWWFWLPAVLLAVLCGWCAYRSVVLPEPITTQTKFDAFYQKRLAAIQITADVEQIQAWFTRHYTIMAVLCGLGFLGWLFLWFQKAGRFRWLPVLVIFLMGDLLWFDYGRNPQCDPGLYYPKIPALERVAQSVPGRVIGVNCLPASLAMMQGLNDIRGYDAVEPARMVDLLEITAQPGPIPRYAVTQFLIPEGHISAPDTPQLAPVLDMLGVRYVVFRGTPPPSVKPAFQGNDYWVLINSNALPRTFVPRSVETVSSDDEQLEKLASPQFNPADVAYVESPVELPTLCRGTAEITNEIPTHIMVSVHMETPGLVVLADNWDRGWRAYWNGRPVPVLRANYAVRGVVVPAGTGTLEFTYKPASLILGLWLAGLAVITLAGWLIAIKIRMVKTSVPRLSRP
ncbi:MAG: hypothetical protein ABSH11_10380 [Verrucomicrobiota bacterium]